MRAHASCTRRIAKGSALSGSDASTHAGGSGIFPECVPAALDALMLICSTGGHGEVRGAERERASRPHLHDTARPFRSVPVWPSRIRHLPTTMNTQAPWSHCLVRIYQKIHIFCVLI